MLTTEQVIAILRARCPHTEARLFRGVFYTTDVHTGHETRHGVVHDSAKTTEAVNAFFEVAGTHVFVAAVRIAPWVTPAPRDERGAEVVQ